MFVQLTRSLELFVDGWALIDPARFQTINRRDIVGVELDIEEQRLALAPWIR